MEEQIIDGLALSGGGFRAALFHIGVLARLAELDLLRRIKVLSTVSGGSIIGTLYYLHVKELLEGTPDHAISRQNYVDIVFRMSREFLHHVQKDLRARTYGNVWSNFRGSSSETFGVLCEKHLYAAWLPKGGGPGRRKKRLLMTDLKIAREDGPQAAVPDLWINATSLSSGRQWVFTPTQMGTIGVSRKRSSWRDVKTEEPIDFLALLKLLDDTVEYREIPGALREFPVGRAVAASACVPGVFPPIKLRFLPWRGGKAAIHLVDGGLIDNLGLRPLEGCPSTVVSDASAPLSHDIKGISKSTFGGLWSSFGALFTFSQAASKQLWEEFLTRKETDIPRHHINLSLAEFRGTIKGVDDSVKKAIINIRTDLDLFTDVEGYALMYAGYQIASGNEKLENLARPDKTEPWPFLVVAEEVKKKNVRNKLLASRSRLKSVRILPVVAWVMILAVVLFLGSNWVVAKLSPDSVREHGLLVGPVLLAEATIVLAILWTVIWFLAACAIAATSWATFLLGRFLLWRDRIPIVSEYDLDANG